MAVAVNQSGQDLQPYTSTIDFVNFWEVLILNQTQILKSHQCRITSPMACVVHIFAALSRRFAGGKTKLIGIGFKKLLDFNVALTNANTWSIFASITDPQSKIVWIKRNRAILEIDPIRVTLPDSSKIWLLSRVFIRSHFDDLSLRRPKTENVSVIADEAFMGILVNPIK